MNANWYVQLGSHTKLTLIYWDALRPTYPHGLGRSDSGHTDTPSRAPLTDGSAG